ncbi:unnamed protein product, partial [Iphiclides podalirius]
MCKKYIFPVKLKLILKEASKDIFFRKVTQPLLKTIKELQSIEKELRHSLKEKDEEIEKYKEEGAKIRKHWRTITFNEEEYLKKIQENGAICKDIPASLLEIKEEKTNSCDVNHKSADINKNPIKEEPQTSDIITIPTIEIKQEIKREASQSSSINLVRKKQKKLNL